MDDYFQITTIIMIKFQNGIIAFLCFTMMCFSSCRKDNNTGPNPIESQDDGLVETPSETYQQEMLDLINEVRARDSNCGGDLVAASNPVRWDSRLYAAAHAHARSMNDKNYFSHTGTDGSDVGARVERTDYNWKYVGENIAFDIADVITVNSGFESSPTHCKVMNNALYTEVGVANVGRYWVVVFAAHL